MTERICRGLDPTATGKQDGLVQSSPVRSAQAPGRLFRLRRFAYAKPEPNEVFGFIEAEA